MTGRRVPVFLWTRRVHYALGLYLLLFIWLFALSGLLLNHEWAFAEFWPNRREDTFVVAVKAPSDADVIAAATDVMAQIGVRGELDATERSADRRHLTFDVARPGESFKVDADLARGRAEVKRTRVNGWGVFRTLHTFSGVRYGQPERQRDWALTTLWVAAMIGSALGLIAIVLTSLYLWWRLAEKRLLGGLVLGAGTVSTGLFVIGLRLI